ncbi:hypothetical protein HDU93_007402 [Gonapodya sp. JEL0774]|nr:hypothetical protein HDU93_007402 [Gonapodya sp. JEL0774]
MATTKGLHSLSRSLLALLSLVPINTLTLRIILAVTASLLFFLLALSAYISQSWKTSQLPTKFRNWSQSWRSLNPTYGFLLSSDASNRVLVATFFPSFLPVYDAFDREILRADAVRYVYMYALGGTYTDLDTVCVRPLDTLWSKFAKQPDHVRGQAFLGRMGTDLDFLDSLPNAWLSSTPHHPLWLFVLRFIFSTPAGSLSARSTRPEEITGPAALFRAVADYTTWAGSTDPARSITIGTLTLDLPDPTHYVLHILASPLIYPVDWRQFFHTPVPGMEVCHAKFAKFNETACNELMDISNREVFVMTYWSASWDGGDATVLDKVD